MVLGVHRFLFCGAMMVGHIIDDNVLRPRQRCCWLLTRRLRRYQWTTVETEIIVLLMVIRRWWIDSLVRWALQKIRRVSSQPLWNIVSLVDQASVAVIASVARVETPRIKSCPAVATMIRKWQQDKDAVRILFLSSIQKKLLNLS